MKYFFTPGNESQYVFAVYSVCMYEVWASQRALVVKNLPANAGDARDTGLIPCLGRLPGKFHGQRSLSPM